MQSSPLLEYARENVIQKAQEALHVLYGQDLWQSYIKKGRWRAIKSSQRMHLLGQGTLASIPVSIAMVSFAMILWWMLNAFFSSTTTLSVPFSGEYLGGLLVGFLAGGLGGRYIWNRVEDNFKNYAEQNNKYDYDEALIALENCPQSPMLYVHEGAGTFNNLQPITSEWDDLKDLAVRAFHKHQLERINAILDAAQTVQEECEKGNVHLHAHPSEMYMGISELFASAGKPEWMITEQMLKLESVFGIENEDIRLTHWQMQSQ